ncbi:MAG: hypothetical protein ABW006_02935 [Hyphomicrobium sp.]
MKPLIIAALTFGFAAGALAGEMHGPGGGGWHGGGGDWGRNSGVLIDVPWNAIDNPNSSQPPDPNKQRCRDARHICFDQFGVDEPGYGTCMTNRGC